MVARRYMEEFGVRIADNGYEVIPIIPGEKRPAGNKWQKFDGSAEGVADYLADNKGDHGVGIKARYAPAVDIDVLDEAVNLEIQEIVREIAGDTPLKRVGLAPKVLWVYRNEAESVWPKVDTGEWFDQKGRKAKVEILSDGQQFVAAHIHPDTKKPYKWLGASVLNTPRDSLTILTHEQAEEIKQRSLQIFLDHGWVKKAGNSITRLANPMDDDDPFSAYRPKVQIGEDELERRLMSIKDNEDHDNWFQIGMALYHQYDGGQRGFDLWREWSESASNYDLAELEKRWPTFDNKDMAHTPITCRIILKLSKDDSVKAAKEQLGDIRDRIAMVMTTDELKEVCDDIKKIEFPPHVHEVLLGVVKARWKDLTKDTPRIGFIRDLIRFTSQASLSAPPWVRPWVFCEETDSLYNTVDRGDISRGAFNLANARYMLSPAERLEGKAAPETQAIDAAMNLYQIPVVRNRMYMPGQPALYSINGKNYANSYTEEGIPELPGEGITPVEIDAINTFLYHFEHIIADARDRHLFLDFIAYIIQNPGQRINWAVLLQGAEGDGKSFFSIMLRAILGANNLNEITGKALEEKYNPWAEGALVCFVEDVRLHGANRFDAINTLKPMITNQSVTIRRMNTDGYMVLNTMNYIATANVKDAMPVGAEDSRFFPIFTRFQTTDAVRAFKAANPDYYNRLYGILQFAGAIRQYLLLKHTFHDDFNPKDRAPSSSHRREMVMLNETEEQMALSDALEESDADDFSSLLLEAGQVPDRFMGSDAMAPRGKALSRLLSQQGFTLMGRWKINGEKRQYWSQKPWVWPEDPILRGEAIRDYLDPSCI